METDLKAHYLPVTEREAKCTGPGQQTDVVSDRKNDDVVSPAAGANSELAAKLAKRRSLIL